MTSRSSQVLTTNVSRGSGIARYYNESDGTSRFYVGQYKKKNVKIFDESWATVGTIENFGQVNSIIMSPVNTVWVADSGRGKIDEFDLYGNFIRNVLSDLSGVSSMSFHPAHPSYLWVTYHDAVRGKNVKRFKIY